MYPEVDFRVHINQLMCPKTCKKRANRLQTTCKRPAKKGKTINSLSLSLINFKNQTSQQPLKDTL